MYRLPQLIAAVILAFAVPFTAWGLSTNVDIQQDPPAWLPGAAAPIDLPPGVEPPQCKLEQGADGDEADARPAACCWFFYGGRWWCVSC